VIEQKEDSDVKWFGKAKSNLVRMNKFIGSYNKVAGVMGQQQVKQEEKPNWFMRDFTKQLNDNKSSSIFGNFDIIPDQKVHSIKQNSALFTNT
jgi:hypothetical protein